MKTIRLHASAELHPFGLRDACLKWFLKQSEALQNDILNFNALPWHQAHASHWPEGLQGDIAEMLAQQPRASRDIQAVFSRQHQLQDKGCIDFSAPQSHWALLPAKQLQNLLLEASIVSQKDFFLKMISRKEREAARMHLGANLFNFATEKAPRMPVQFKLPTMQSSRPMDLTFNLMRVARQIFEQLYADYPKAFLKRFCLKFPKGFPWDFSPKPKMQSPESIQKLLLKLTPQSTQQEAITWNKSYV